jgi:hypothetical protein
MNSMRMIKDVERHINNTVTTKHIIWNIYEYYMNHTKDTMK